MKVCVCKEDGYYICPDLVPLEVHAGYNLGYVACPCTREAYNSKPAYKVGQSRKTGLDSKGSWVVYWYRVLIKEMSMSGTWQEGQDRGRPRTANIPQGSAKESVRKTKSLKTM